MDTKDIAAWCTVIGIIAGALIGVWKKVVKPIVKAVKQYYQVVENSQKISYNGLRLDSVIYLSEAAMFECDISGGLSSANRLFVELVGSYHENELSGYGFINFIISEERSQFRMEWLDSVLRDEEVRKNITIKNRKNGEIIPCYLSACFNRDDKNKLINIVAKVSVLK